MEFVRLQVAVKAAKSFSYCHGNIEFKNVMFLPSQS